MNNEIIQDKELYVKYSEVIDLHNEVEQLKNTSKDNGTSETTTNPHEVREEIALLRKENESLKTELRWKDHMLLNIPNAQLPQPANVRKVWIDGNSKKLSKTKSNDDTTFVYPRQKHIIDSAPFHTVKLTE